MVKESNDKGKRRSLERQQEIIARWRASGLNKQAYCRREGILLSSFGRWFKSVKFHDLRKEVDCLKRVEENFIPISLRAEPHSFPLQPQLEVVLANGCRLNIQGPFEWERVSLFLKPLLVG